MIQLGKINTLRVVKLVDFGVYLDGGEDLEILLPTRYVPQNTEPEDEIDVFIYHDNEGRLIATTDRPIAIAEEFAYLKCKSVGNMGAFMDIGIMKDLLVPFREMKMEMVAGKYYLVYVHVDHVTNRLVGSARIDKFLNTTPPLYETNQEVDILIAEETEIGYKVIINHSDWGLIYHNQIFTSIERGSHYKGYIKEVREDEKIDVSLTPLGYSKVGSITTIIQSALVAHNGFMKVHDKSSPEEIYALFGCSKKAFKQAIGALYKQKLIEIQPTGIRLIKK